MMNTREIKLILTAYACVHAHDLTEAAAQAFDTNTIFSEKRVWRAGAAFHTDLRTDWIGIKTSRGTVSFAFSVYRITKTFYP